MSFGSLSAPAVEALNRGCHRAGCLQNTGEGGISPYHRHGGELIWQIGTGYFGCRDAAGRFSMERFRERLVTAPVRAIEIKISQGAKPGLGGLLPGVKVSPEIAAIRGIPAGKTCISPARHSAFGDVDSMLDFVEKLAEESGLPVGIKSAVGEIGFWRELAHLMATTDRGVDFITIDGGEGGTGAGPLVFTDHVALPFKQGFIRVYREFAEAGIQNDLLFIGSGRLGFPELSILAFSLGCDMIAVGREAMMAVGCIQAQRCHTGHCPTGVATQNRWLMRGLDPTLKSDRLANYIATLRKELLSVASACGVSQGEPDLHRRGLPDGGPHAVGHGGLRRVRAGLAPGTAARRHRPSQAARGLPGPQENARAGAGGPAPPTGPGRRGKDPAGPRVRHQPANPLQIPAHRRLPMPDRSLRTPAARAIWDPCPWPQGWRGPVG